MIEILSSQSLWVTVVAGFTALAMLILSPNPALSKIAGLAEHLPLDNPLAHPRETRQGRSLLPDGSVRALYWDARCVLYRRLSG
jgi:hypothetical protein